MKFAYCTTITKDDYIPCIILNKRFLDYFNSQYPFVVLVTNNVSKRGIEWLKEFNIIVKEVPLFEFQNSSLPGCSMHFSSLSLIEYDYVLSFEADILFLDNPDFYFENYKKIKPNHNFYFENENWSDVFNKNKIFNILSKTQFYLCKPNMAIYEQLKYFCTLELVNSFSYSTDHDLIKIFYYHEKQNNKQTDDISIPYIHFAGYIKFWNIFKNQFSFIDVFFDNNCHTLEKVLKLIKENDHFRNTFYDFTENYAHMISQIILLDNYFKES